jgi:hypothetical protein
MGEGGVEGDPNKKMSAIWRSDVSGISLDSASHTGPATHDMGGIYVVWKVLGWVSLAVISHCTRTKKRPDRRKKTTTGLAGKGQVALWYHTLVLTPSQSRSSRLIFFWEFFGGGGGEQARWFPLPMLCCAAVAALASYATVAAGAKCCPTAVMICGPRGYVGGCVCAAARFCGCVTALPATLACHCVCSHDATLRSATYAPLRSPLLQCLSVRRRCCWCPHSQGA